MSDSPFEINSQGITVRQIDDCPKIEVKRRDLFAVEAGGLSGSESESWIKVASH